MFNIELEVIDPQKLAAQLAANDAPDLIRAQDRYSDSYAPRLFTYTYPITDTGMDATFQYPREEFEAQYREYYYRFLFVLLGVSLFSFLLASMLSGLLSKPIERLMGSINHASKVHFDHLVQGGPKQPDALNKSRQPH